MTKNDQQLFYASVGRALTKAREQHKLSVSQLAAKSGEQYNSVKAIEDGRPFSFHHGTWMRSILGMNLNVLLTDAVNENSIEPLKEDDNGEESKQEGSDSDISDLF